MQETEKIWMNGELVDWADAKVHVGVHGLHYGTGVFEGIRCYETPKGPAVFRLRDHLQRLHDSARLLYMELPYSVDELREATHELIGVNGLPECYLRPIAFYGYGELGVSTVGNPVDTVIMSWPWGAYLGEEGLRSGIRAKVSSWQRVGPNVIPHVAKATGIYLNSMLAVTEAQRAGYDEAILLTDDGYVADGSGENVFVVKDGRISRRRSRRRSCPGSRATRDRDRPGPRLRGRGDDAHPHRPLPRGRGLHGRHGGRGDAAARDRRSRDRRRAGDDGAAGGVPRHGARPHRALVALARRRRAGARRARDGRSAAVELSARISTSARRSSSSRCCAPDACRSGRGSTASRSSSRRASARRTRRRSRPARPACTCSAASPASGRRRGRSRRRTRSSRRRTARSTRARRRSSRTSTRNAQPRSGRRRGGDHAAHEAVVAVDIFGYPCELDPLRELCDRHGLVLIQDACEALGAVYAGRPVGSHGRRPSSPSTRTSRSRRARAAW